MPDSSRLRLALTLVLLCWPCGLFAQAAAQQRAYDVRDMLADVANFTNAPALGIVEPDAPAAAPAPNAKTQDERAAELVSLVRSLVPGDALPDDAVRILQGQLVVRATPEAHGAVARVVEDLRQRLAPQALVEARVYRPDAAARSRLAEDAPALARKLKLASFRGGAAAGTELTADEAAVLERVTGGVVSAPRLTLFPGQRGYVLVATQRAFVGALVPKKGADGAPVQPEQFEPRIKTVEAGVVLDGRTTPTRDGRFVAVSARVTLCTLHDIPEVPAPGLPQEKGLKVQLPDYEREVADVQAVAADGVALLFGITETSRPNAPEDAEPSDPAYVVLKATAVGLPDGPRDGIN